MTGEGSFGLSKNQLFPRKEAQHACMHECVPQHARMKTTTKLDKEAEEGRYTGEQME